MERGDSRLFPLDRRLSGPYRQSAHSGEKRNLFPLPVIERQFLGHSGRSLISIPTGLNKLKKYFRCDCLFVDHRIQENLNKKSPVWPLTCWPSSQAYIQTTETRKSGAV